MCCFLCSHRKRKSFRPRAIPLTAFCAHAVDNAPMISDGDRNDRSHNTSENSVQNRAFQSRNLNPIRKSDLAAVGHGLELPAFFPWFLLVPWDGGSATIVRIADEGCFLLCCARCQRDYEC